MTRQHVRFGLVLLACCALTAFVTRRSVLDAVRADYGQAGAFDHCKDALAEFVANRSLADGQRVEGENLPASLREVGVVGVYRRGRLLHFVLPKTDVGGDEATPEFVYNLDKRGGVVEEVVHATDRYTYHVQPYAASPHWYYWVHN